ncbi:MAG: hypothetical protein AAFV62_04955 [Pseudomonadota bacterium]
MVEHTLITGAHVAKTAGSTVSMHAKKHLGEPGYYRYCRFSRARRFWVNEPQYEELSEEERLKIRFLFGHGVSQDVIALQSRDPALFITIRHPVPFFHSRFAHEKKSAQKYFTSLSLDGFIKKERRNYFVWFIVEHFGRLGEYGDEMSLRNAISILKCFRYVFATEKIDTQAKVLWTHFGIPGEMDRVRVNAAKDEIPVSDQEIIEMHALDAELFDVIASEEPTGKDDAFNPFGFDQERYQHVVTRERQADRDPIHEAYSELAGQLASSFMLEAAVDQLDRGNIKSHRSPELLRECLNTALEARLPRYNDKQSAASKENVEKKRVAFS